MTDVINSGELIVVRGAGEMATGVIHRFHNEGYSVVALEQAAPTCVRRAVCFAEAVYEREVSVEDVTARLIVPSKLELKFRKSFVPLLIDPTASLLHQLSPAVLIDARMFKRESDCLINLAPIVIGLGPGFCAGQNCHAVVETNRGPNLGKVIYDGESEPYTGTPATVQGVNLKRVLRAPVSGELSTALSIGDLVSAGQEVCRVNAVCVPAEISGVVHGLLRDGTTVSAGQKLGDVDPRGDRELCFRISDKARAIAEGVAQAVAAFDSHGAKA